MVSLVPTFLEGYLHTHSNKFNILKKQLLFFDMVVLLSFILKICELRKTKVPPEQYSRTRVVCCLSSENP
jgi:hypothetical protein